jgi:hypothetical protein
MLQNKISLYLVHDKYGANINECRTSSEKILASYKPPGGEYSIRAIHADFHIL